MDYNKAFEGYNVPENLKHIATLISKRFAITGLCDPMYITNMIATTCGIGDGRGNFTDCNISNYQTIAERIQSAYGCNIIKDEISELKYIIETGSIDKEKAIKGMKAFIKRIEDEKRKCDGWRIDYLNTEIETLKQNILELE